MATLAQDVKHVKLAKAFNKDHKKLHVCLRPGSPSSELMRAVLIPMFKDHKETALRVLQGVAPRGDLERRVQQWLESGVIANLEEVEE